MVGFTFTLKSQQGNIELLLDKVENATSKEKAYVDLSDSKNWIVKSGKNELFGKYYFALGKLSAKQLELDSAIFYYKKALDYYQKFKNAKGECRSYIGIGNAYFVQGKYAVAADNFLIALKIAEKNSLNQQMASAFKNIGFCKLKIKKYDEAIGYYNQAQTLLSELKDSSGLSAIMVNIGNAYYEKGDNNSFINYNLKALALSKQINDSINMAFALNNIGAAYVNDLKDTLKGVPYLLEAIKIKEKFNMVNELIFSYDNVGSLYIYLNKLDSSKYYLDKASALAIKAAASSDLIDIYGSYASYYKYKGDYKTAFSFIVKQSNLKDSIFTIENSQIIQDAESMFEIEKKELQLEKNKLELESQHKQNVIKNIIIFSIIVLTLLIGLFVYSSYKNFKKQQQLKLENQLQIEKENSERQIQEAGEKERRRIAQDLHDNMGAHTTSILAQIDKLTYTNANTNYDFLRSDAENIMAMLRETIWILKTKTISINDFYDLVKNYSNKQLQQKLNINVIYRDAIVQDKYLSPAVTLNLYRIVQETIQNIIKHSKAKNVEFNLSSTGNFFMQISDDGEGFDINNISSKSGLENMEFRALEINYHIEISSGINNGTKLLLAEKV